MADNPPRGAVVDYVLKAAAPGPVTLEILDPKGGLVRRWSSDEKPRPPDLSRIVVTPDWVTPAEPLSAAAGMHRFVWDLRDPLPKELACARGYRSGAGPWTPPGRYAVRLTAAGKVLTQPLDVVKDPRLGSSVSDAELVRQHEVASEIQAERVRVAVALREASALRKQLAALRKDAAPAPAARDALAAFTKALDRAAGPPAPGSGEDFWDTEEIDPVSLRRLATSLSGLQYAVESADAAPTPDALTGLSLRKKMADEGLARWRDVVVRELPDVNRSLEAAGLAPLKTDP